MFESTFFSVSFSIILLVGILLLMEVGQRLGRRRQEKDGDAGRAGLAAVEGAVLALMGLLVAFTFSGAANRFDARRELILREANAIGTAWLRLDLLPASSQPEMRDLFRRYLDTRLSIYQKLPDFDAARLELDRANALQQEIWTHAVAAVQQAPPPVTGLMLPALNDMFDIATARTTAKRTHQPVIIFWMLGGLSLLSALLTGFAMSAERSRGWVHRLGFAIIMAVTVYIILDLEFPRIGFIRVSASDRVLYEVRDSMK